MEDEPSHAIELTDRGGSELGEGVVIALLRPYNQPSVQPVPRSPGDRVSVAQ
jgi:hypothetical protein